MGAITIGGPPGSGTTTIAKLLSERLKWKYVYTGDIFRELAKSKNLSLVEFGKYAEKHPEIDRQLDSKQLELAKMGSIILEGRVSGWIVHKNEVDAFKIWLKAEDNIRAKRVAEREGKSEEEVMKVIKEREESERTRYMKLYNFDLSDLSFYDIVVDTGPILPEKICEIIMTKLQGKNR